MAFLTIIRKITYFLSFFCKKLNLKKVPIGTNLIFVVTSSKWYILPVLKVIAAPFCSILIYDQFKICILPNIGPKCRLCRWVTKLN